jgi:hypothetical protein
MLFMKAKQIQKIIQDGIAQRGKNIRFYKR